MSPEAALTDDPPEATGGAMGLALAVGLCVLASAFFSFSETCLTSLSDSRAHALIARGGRRARVLLLWLERPHEVLTAILVGNNLANIVATALMTRLAQDLWGQAAVSVAVGIMTFLVLVFGEVTPKTLARRHAAAVAVPALHVLRPVNAVLRPVTWLLAKVAVVALRLSGGQGAGGRDVTEEEIEAMIDLGRREGALPEDKSRYLRGIFELETRTVREIMVARPDVVALDLDQPIDELVRQVDEAPHSRLPAYRGTIDRIVGVVHVKDMMHVLARRKGRATAEDFAGVLREPRFVPESLALNKLLDLFLRSRQHLVVVLDEYGGTTGLATLEDVLEELVGEIQDEYDPAVDQLLVSRGPESWTAPGRLAVSVLEQELDLQLPREQPFDTLAGLLMHLAGEVPAVGSEQEWGGFRFRVVTGDAKRVGIVRLDRIAPEDASLPRRP